MNIRKPADYSVLFSELDKLIAAQLPQMELYREIGRVVSSRAEKGAAVAASEHLQVTYPAAEGFSPREPAPGCGTSTGCTATRRSCWQRQCV